MAQRNRLRQDRPILFLDPQTEYITIGKMRLFTTAMLRELRNPVVVTSNSRPKAIIMSYEQYLVFQENWIKAVEMANKMSDQFTQIMLSEQLKQAMSKVG